MRLSGKNETCAYCILKFFYLKMQSRIRFILAFLLIFTTYLVYLVVYYKYQDFRVNVYIGELETENVRLYNRIEQKKDTYESVQTPAYIDRIMKISQNRMNAGEQAIFFVDQKEVANYAPIDTTTTISARKIPSKTAGMTYRQKWLYYLFGIMPK